MSWLITPSFSFDPDAAAYIAAVEAADTQALEINTRYAINNFVIGCKQDGTWSAIKASCILAAARTLAGALVPLAGTAPSVVGALSYARKTGLSSAGASPNCLDTQVIPTDYPTTNFHVSFYNSSGITTIGETSNIATFINNVGNARIRSSTSIASTLGVQGANTLIGGSRTDGSTVTLRANKMSAVFSSASSSAATSNLFLFRFASSFVAGTCAFYSIGESLNLALLDARVTDLINALAVAIP